MAPTVRITRAPIDVAKVLRAVRDPSAGGMTLFLGTVRDRNEGRAVRGLEYQVYKGMAEKRMSAIEAEVRTKWPVRKMVMVHRYGRLRIGEVSVAVAVATEHRADAFGACRYAIDTIKRTLPLWKRESLSGGGEAWTKGEPIGA
ncbi:MAG: molybdenum cofactor biosynthesis protein MoaE [Nitrososphaerota archaeon]|nr:molybdenum cofactor biosynthesis protein MoaE [Nitrososphaerota archaeon]MDG6968499.1 molybdenum cofactor biosynthesis protein MoaE [Nitrososphaerota archaeon]MDG6973373.1 molybdenum cofactor biosynthesis protein MoaE [Nitrososphaerota archaeon]MDG6975431.1 molybdenum cofactor biosynthesis protein MoaE [Nitrososphaerota archaeon]